MSEIWERLSPDARDRVDAELRARGVVWAVMVLRGECGLDPVPGLYEAQDALIDRRQSLIDRGLLKPEPSGAELDVEDVLAVVDTITVPVVAIEALWDGDTQGWRVELVAIVDRPGQRLERFDETPLASISHGSDLRLFHVQVPPWPEAAAAQRVGSAVAARLGVPFHFTSPNMPDVDLPRWWDSQPAAVSPRQYRYVGPVDVLAAVSSQEGGRRIDSAEDLVAWMEVLTAAERSQPHTFIIDVGGGLRLAPRQGEHVACAGGRPVLSAGEIAFTWNGRRWSVVEVSKSSR